ncbi:MAG: cytochrome b/b6 domain-containing protein [Bacteroidetes bacterium]|nr:cytochrome b/b6 domain-containing protein [Bacteroidota bacterium]
MNFPIFSGFNEKHSLALRLWHWIFFLLITSSMICVLLASTLFRTRNNTEMVQQQLQRNNITVDANQARAVSHAFNDKLWDWHTDIGYFIAIFLAGRFLLEIFQPKEEKLSTRIKTAMGFTVLSVYQKSVQVHYVRVKWGYIVFYALMLIMVLTGLGLAFEQVAFLKANRGLIKQTHSLTQYAIYAFVLFHLTGVILADAGNYPGIVSGMIHGKRRI